MKIGVLGTGKMGSTLARLLSSKGHQVMLGSRDPGKIVSSMGHYQAVTSQAALSNSDIVILAIPWTQTEDFITQLSGWENKIVIDITNSLSPDVSHLLVGGDTSAAERIAEKLPNSSVVKAFNTINAANLPDPGFCGEQAQLFFCGDDQLANSRVAELIDDLGFIPIDCGALNNARYLEAMAMLWIQLAFEQDYGMAFSFKLAKKADSASRINSLG